MAIVGKQAVERQVCRRPGRPCLSLGLSPSGQAPRHPQRSRAVWCQSATTWRRQKRQQNQQRPDEHLAPHPRVVDLYHPHSRTSLVAVADAVKYGISISPAGPRYSRHHRRLANLLWIV